MGNTSNPSVLPLKRNIKKEADNPQEEFQVKINELSERISQIEQKVSDSNSNAYVKELREEIIEGIRMLGKRVSKAVQDIDIRFQEFKENLEKEPQNEIVKQKENSAKPMFGNIKENDLLDGDNYEVVSKNEVDKLTNMFRKQSDNIRHFIEMQQHKITEFEHILNIYDDENNKLKEKMKKNFTICVAGICIVTVLLIIFQFI